MKKTLFICFSAFFFISPRLYSLTTTVDFLKLSIGARGTGMGDSCVASCPDATAVYWNPAGLAGIEKPELGFMHSEAITDASLEFVGFAYPTRFGTFALSGVFYIIDPIPVTMANGETIGDLNWMDKAIGLSYGRNILPGLSAGAGFKWIHRTESDPIFGSAEGSAYAFDAGLICKTPVKGLDAGVSVMNSGTELKMTGETKKDALPQISKLGFSYDYPLDRSTSLSLATDLHKINDGNWFPGAGIELAFQNRLFVRGGYYKKEGNIQGTTYGAGFRIKYLQIDYSNVPVSEMVGYERNNKISILVRFN